MKKKLEMKNDGKDAERFEAMLKTVVNVPKEDVKKYEEGKRKRLRKNPTFLLRPRFF